MSMPAQAIKLRSVLASKLATLELPQLPVVRNAVWKQHASYIGAPHFTFESPAGAQDNDYERLEHVGDALLGSAVTLLIHKQYPRLAIGARTLVKAALVENVALAQLAARYQMPDQILTAAAQRHLLQSNDNVRASVFEAYLATLHNEAGPDAFEQFVHGIYSALVPILVEALRQAQSSSAITVSKMSPSVVNWVGLLGEWAVARGSYGRVVTYGAPQREGLDHDPLWFVTCSVRRGRGASQEMEVFTGEGPTIASAESE